MPRTLHPELRDMIERPNPYSEYRIEIVEPDVSQVLRRQDQFLAAPSLVSMSPALSLSASARGALILTPSTTALATFAGILGSFDLNTEDQNRRVKGLSWTIDSAFSRATLKSILAKVQAIPIAGSFFFDQTFECQIYQIVKTPGIKTSNVGSSNYQSTAFTRYDFAQLLTPAPVVTVTAAQWGVSAIQQLNFDFSNFGLILENIPTRAASPDQTGTLPKYLIVVRITGKTLGGTGHFRWLTDTVASHSVGAVGTFDRVFWAKDSDDAQWVEAVSGDVPNCIVNIETYPSTGQGIYLIDQGAVPRATSVGRIELERSLPAGTAVTAELSTAGSGGPWTPVLHGDVVSIRQQQYHLRTTLTSDGSHRATPEVLAQGIEFRTPQDVSVEAIPTMPTREISLPWPKASIPEGKLRVVRFGSRDYLDVGSVLGSTSATSRLEADIFLASRHPSITRDKWFRLERMMVSSRLPSATSEEFTLLSYAARLKRKIPQKAETLSSVHTVASSTTAQVIVSTTPPSSALPGTTPTGNEYDGKNYYMRVRSTSAANIPVGFVATIQGNAGQVGLGTTGLDFTPSLPQALVAGDVIEVHSGVFATQVVSYTNADPADVWWDVLTNLLAIPPERIGIGALPRGGRPPKVTDIAPGDVTTQNKRKVTGRLSEETEGDKILDVLSAIMGGVTIEIDGQICFVQLIPLTDVSGAVTVPLPPPAAMFDIRDFSAPPQTPLGLEQRATVVSAKYGVPATTASPDSFPSKATTAVDSDALLWLSQQDLEDFGAADVPDEINKWLYNITDDGLYLASVLGAQLVRVASTGLRVWPLSMTEKHPTLVPGDVIVISIDSYTDYDPSTQTQIKGPLAIRGILVKVGNEGRQLSMFVPGLRDNVQLIAGGGVGALTGLGPQPAPPILTASFDATGQLIINSSGDFATASQKIAWATGAAPSAATVRAATPIAQQNVSGLATGSVYPAGTTVFIAAFAYSGTALESTPLAVISKSREGSGTSAPPVPTITPLNTEIDDSVWNLQFSGIAGSGGGGANLTYTIKSKIGVATYTTLSSGNATAFPLNLGITRDERGDKVVKFEVTDTATGLFAYITWTVPSQRNEIDSFGHVLRGRTFSDGKFAPKASDAAGSIVDTSVTESGGKAINRLLGKTLAGDPDTLDGTPEGTTYKRVHNTAVDTSTSKIDFTKTGFLGKNGDNVGRSAADATVVSTVVQQLNSTGGHALTTMQESGGKAINRLLGKALAADPDTLDSAPDGTTYKKIVSVVSGQITPPSSVGRNRCRLTKSGGAFAIGSGGTVALPWDNEIYDVGGLHDNVSNNTRIIIPSGGNTGAWLFMGQVSFAGSVAGSRREVYIAKNGTPVAEFSGPGTTNGPTYPAWFLDDAPSPTDYYELLAFQDSGGNLNVNLSFQYFSAQHLW
jgi:hypothetical protein